MATWFVPELMSKLAGQTVSSFGYDQTNSVQYQFNQLGFRSDEIGDEPSLFVVGNSVSFGVGLAVQDTYGHILSQQLELKLANISFGCYLHENHEHLSNIQQIADRNVKDTVVIQINNLGRRQQHGMTTMTSDADWAVTRLVDYYNCVESMLAHVRHYYVYWDDQSFDIPREIQRSLVIHNKLHIDNTDNMLSFGPKSHRAIAKTLLTVVDRS